METRVAVGSNLRHPPSKRRGAHHPGALIEQRSAVARAKHQRASGRCPSFLPLQVPNAEQFPNEALAPLVAGDQGVPGNRGVSGTPGVAGTRGVGALAAILCFCFAPRCRAVRII